MVDTRGLWARSWDHSKKEGDWSGRGWVSIFLDIHLILVLEDEGHLHGRQWDCLDQ